MILQRTPETRNASRPAPRRLRFPAAVLAALVAAGLSACTAFTGLADRQVTPIPVDSARAARLISAYRATRGLPPVTVDASLTRVAADYARTMGERDRIGHGLGARLTRRADSAGYQWGYIAENLGAGYDGLDRAMAGWKASPGHDRNLLSPLAREIGIAAVAVPSGSRYRTYWALVLGARAEPRLAASEGRGLFR